ncbi:Npun_F0296 family exosortase-dependent surface protein [Alteromonas sp. BMJM2]|uniref:Npun_F0296 family exosortase-dependent surface protein n=1 Tax=Alteromonas sp. BMJM2 TaxID=2954241 RepID=UPI0022B34978|nr:hypothetical protein [Alteromonas sp. BMJM2]
MTLRSKISILAFVALLSSATNAAVILTLESPTLALTSASQNTLLEDFDTVASSAFLNAYTTAFGTYSTTSGGVSVNNANMWGGAGGNGKYLYVPGGGSSLTLTFKQPVGYFGFWWSAGDDRNKLSIETSKQTLDFTTSDILSSPALSSLHFGNPFWLNPASPAQYAASWQPFAFVNLFADSQVDAMKSITFYGSNFETDNHTVNASILGQTGLTVSTLGVTTVPAPSTMSIGLLSLALFAFRKKAITLKSKYLQENV